MRTGQHGAAIAPDGIAIHLRHRAAQAHGVSGLGPREFPGCAAHQPGVRPFSLCAVDKRLLEHTELIAQAVAKRWQPQRGHGIQEASRQATQAAVTQRGIGLLGQGVFERAGMGLQRGSGGAGQVQRIQGVGKRPAHQKFHRQVIDPLGLGLRISGLGGDPASGQLLAGDQRQGLHCIVGVGFAGHDS